MGLTIRRAAGSSTARGSSRSRRYTTAPRSTTELVRARLRRCCAISSQSGGRGPLGLSGNGTSIRGRGIGGLFLQGFPELSHPFAAEHFVHPRRHERGGRSVAGLVEPIAPLARLEVELERPRAIGPGLAYEARCGIDGARCADRDEEIGAVDCAIYLVHPVRHLAEP